METRLVKRNLKDGSVEYIRYYYSSICDPSDRNYHQLKDDLVSMVLKTPGLNAVQGHPYESLSTFNEEDRWVVKLVVTVEEPDLQKD